MNRRKKHKQKKRKRASTGTISGQNALNAPAGIDERHRPWHWPPRDLPMSHREVQRIKFAIDEAERIFKEATAQLPASDSDVMSHDQHLSLLLFDFASLIYSTFLDQAEDVLRRGEWTLHDFSINAGLFLRDIGEGLFQKFRNLASSPENKIEWKAEVFAHSELVWAVLNSVRVRQKGTRLTESAKEHLFGAKTSPLDNPEKLRNDIAKSAGIVSPVASDPDIVKRRVIVKQNPGLSNRGLCGLFDSSKIPLPKTMAEAGTWEKAYKAPQHRHPIDSLISRDRNIVN